MNKPLNTYPMLTNELLNNIGLKFQHDTVPYAFNFFQLDKDCKESELGVNILEKSNEISFSNFNKDSRLKIKVNYTIHNPSFLFNIKNGGIARSQGATIGLAINWISPNSLQRGTLQIGEIYNTNKEVTISNEYIFEKEQFRGDIFFESFLYLKEIGEKETGESYLADRIGLVLGYLHDTFVLHIDGKGSIFPIYSESVKGNPLWHVSYDSDSPLTDDFSENVKIYINTLHPDYETFSQQDNIAFRNEIYSSALLCLISDIKNIYKEEWKFIVENNGLEVGSVGSVIYYFINSLQWDFNSFSDLSAKIRVHFDKLRRK